MVVEGATFGILGALAAFPRRLATREVARRGGAIRRGITRRTTHVVFGRTLLDKLADDEIAQRADAVTNAGATPLSENGFRRVLGLLRRPEGADLPRQSLLDQSGLDPRSFRLLALFDAFEHDAEPFSFRDVILARKYARLLNTGAGWGAIARSVHRAGKVTSLTRMALHSDGADAIYVRDGEALTEIDGQHLLPFEEDVDRDADALFERAEEAETAEDFASAAMLYAQYLSLDPSDSVAAFNRANALRAAGNADEASHAYALAIKLDPNFAEAWFNFGSLLNETGRIEAARSHLARATALDPNYADPIYNLGALEYDAGRLDEARRWWVRYLELDRESEWGRRAARGIQYIDLKLAADRKARGPGRIA
jgi:tetratricopeptide (TPR) repeat protein